MAHLPRSNDLQDLFEAIDSRSKHFKSRSITVDKKLVSQNEDNALERVEIKFLPHSKLSLAQVQFYFWEDRWAWIDARERGKRGWRWQWTTEGRVLPSHLGGQLTRRIEMTVEEASHFSAGTEERLNNIWKGVLTTGPKGVKQNPVIRPGD